MKKVILSISALFLLATSANAVNVIIDEVSVEQKSGWGRLFADVNGDNKSDIVFRVGNQIMVSLSADNSFLPATRWTLWSAKDDFKLADVNGDGSADLIGRTGSYIYVSLSTGNNFIPLVNWTPWDSHASYNLADVNGDGMADLIGRLPNSENVHVALSIDNNADGFGDEFKKPSQVWTTWNVNDDYKLADVNGDGNADLVGRYLENNEIYVKLAQPNEESKFGDKQKWTVWDISAEYKLADINGDGAADLVGRLVNNNEINEMHSNSKF